MDNYVQIGKIINTFGIKGELKIASDFEYKDRIFKGMGNIYIGIGEDLKAKKIVNYRVHKGYDLLTLDGYTNINEVLQFKNKHIYVLRDDLNLSEDEYLVSDLIGFEVYDNDKLIGIIIDYESSRNNTLLKIKGEKTFYIPLIDEYILNVNIKERKVLTINGGDLII